MKSRNHLIVSFMLVLVFTLIPTTYAAPDLSWCYQESFKITGYYSPEKGQWFYAKGNFEDEKVLNGNGTHGASGKEVFNGMIAAPKLYDFGTKIYLPGFGVGSVDDRGGAIVEKGERGEKYNRIDIWMGHGEDGLQRAISLWVAYKNGWVCPKKSSLKVWFDRNQFTILHNFFQNTLWRVQLWKGRNDPWVGSLQGYLKKLGYFKADINNTFWETTKTALCNFQHTILWVKKTDFWCWYFGTSSRDWLRAHLQKKGLLNSKLQTSVAIGADEWNGPKLIVDEVIVIKKLESWVTKQNNKQSMQTIQPELKNRQQELNSYYLNAGDSKKFQFLTDISFWTKSLEVKLLQRKLQWMGYYKTQITGTYDEPTKAAIFQFQIDKKILKHDDTSVSKGWLGTKTRELLNKVK
jgi:3D (Asp-Asp-Asp) domain-containing protein